MTKMTSVSPEKKFVLDSFIGADVEEPISIDICANKAYRDFNRTLRGIGTWGDNNKEKYDEYKKAIFDILRKRIAEELLNANDSEKFSEYHKQICEEITRVSKKYDLQNILTQGFHDGVAQKWLNMTLKYMLVLSEIANKDKSIGFDLRWDTERMVNIRKYLHVPVDTQVIEAASSCFGIEVSRKHPTKDGKKNSKYSESVSKPWSQWDYENDYEPFQKELRCKLQSLKDPKWKSVIDWELDTWKPGSV